MEDRMKIFLMLILISFTGFAQDTLVYTNTEYTSTFELVFSQPMDTTELLNPNNYSIVNTRTREPLEILGIGIVLERGVNKTPITDNSVILLITERASYKETYNITVTGVKGKNGVLIGDKNNLSYFFSGRATEIKKPKPRIYGK